MNKIMETLQLNINEYIETKLCKYQNEETEQQLQNIRKDMFNYKKNFQKMLNKGLINEQQFEYIKNDWFHYFDILETFLEECNTKMFIGFLEITNALRNNISNLFFELRTNICLKIRIYFEMISGVRTLNCFIYPTNDEICFEPKILYFRLNNNNPLQFNDYLNNNCIFDNTVMRDHQRCVDYQNPFTTDKLQSLAKKINLVSKNPNFYQLDLDYLQLQDDPTIKCFMEKNHSIQLAEKNTKIKQLQKIIEKKCETIEQLNTELTKQKNNFANLNKERVKNNEYHKIKMDELQFAINKKTEEQRQLIEKHNLNIENLKQQYQNENYDCVNSLKEKIIRLQTELNQKNIANKKLTIQLNDLNELYENLQEKLI